jgi:2-oxoglutarate dehydrogenase E2 component (dihydrolipoamide succinyltransferase)
MMESLQNSAQLTTVVEVDVTEIAALRGEHKARLESGFSVEQLFAGE